MDDERLVAEGLESHLESAAAGLVAADRRGRGQRPTVPERGQLDEEILFRRGEEIEAPLDHGGQRAVPCGRCPAPTAEKVEPSGQSIAQLTDPQVLQGGRGQLDGERKAVEASDDLGNLPDGHVVPGELGSRLHSSIEEESNRAAVDRSITRLELGQGHGTERLHALAVDVQCFPTRGENPDVRAQSQELLDERRDGLNQVLTVVEDEQRAWASARRPGQRAAGPEESPRVQPQSPGVGARVADGGQVDDPDSVGELTGDVVAGLDGQTGLAHTARPHDRDQPVVSQEALERGPFAVAADETWLV